MCRYHTNIVKKQLFKQIPSFKIQYKKNMPILSALAHGKSNVQVINMSFLSIKSKLALYTKTKSATTNVPPQLEEKLQSERNKCRHFKNCDTGHSKNILNTCYRLRVSPQQCSKSTFLFKHKPLLSSDAHGKSNVQVINMSFLCVKSKLALYTKTKSATTNVPLNLQKNRNSRGDKCRCHLRQDFL